MAIFSLFYLETLMAGPTPPPPAPTIPAPPPAATVAPATPPAATTITTTRTTAAWSATTVTFAGFFGCPVFQHCLTTQTHFASGINIRDHDHEFVTQGHFVLDALDTMI